MNQPRQILLALTWLAGTTLVGTAGYVVLEGWSWYDGLYMTVVTLSTVGYNEVHETGPAGRAWTMALIALGVGTALYLISVIAEIVFAGGLRDFARRVRMRRTLERISGHVVIAGFGRFGETVSSELRDSEKEVVVVEIDPAREPDLIASGRPYVIGSATNDDCLLEAGIERAEALVVATSDDSDNVFVTLSARELAPEIRIHARGETEATLRRLKRAGADHVVSPYQLGGIRTAASVLRPTVVEFLELFAPGHGPSVDIEEIRVEPDSGIVGRSVGEVEAEGHGLRVVGLRKAGAEMVILPRADAAIDGGGHLVAIGERDHLLALAQLAQSPVAGKT